MKHNSYNYEGGQPFKVEAPFTPTGDQPTAIQSLTDGIERGEWAQVLLGATGTGKTFTMAKVIEAVQKPTLIIAHNKTLAAQLCSEFKSFFPNNAVEYFVSYYDFYQPEAYIPSSDTYIEKDASINDEIDKLRHSATMSLFERRDVIIVASVSCIYGLGDPEDYSDLVLSLRLGQTKSRDEILSKLVDIQYTRNDMNFIRGTFRVQGDTIEIFPAAYSERAIRVELFGDEIDRLVEVDALTGEVIAERKHVAVYPASHYVTTKEKMKIAVERIEAELDEQLAKLKAEDRLLEAQRLEQRTRYDIEMMQEMGYCSGIENYSRHMSERKAGEAPYTLIDYFPDDFLIMVDESHVTIPQVRAMYNGDRARKESLIEYGFRLPSALDNRPLKFDEFVERINQIVYVSATPGPYEMEVETNVAEQIIRPTGLLDPSIEIRPIKGQMDDLLGEIHKRAAKNERVLVTTLTKKMAEDLTEFLKEMGVRVRYLHSDIVTIERAEIIRDLRAGVFDVLVGINLLREGLDMPEVSLVAILDADKEGFLRSDTAMIQTIGRAARNVNGHVIMYADRVTGSMQRAMDETDRRRAVQEAYNIEHHITPKSVSKDVKELIELTKIEADMVTDGKGLSPKKGKKKSSAAGMDHGHEPYAQDADTTKVAEITAEELYNKIEELDRQMKAAAKQLEFEKAAKLRDQLGELRQQWSDMHSVGESKLKKPRKNSKKQSPKSKKVHI
ncbi:excinuclease ABC subunit UvrB [Veillonella atypica]|uniref:UvrABC system protein B n=1 Tax=Veillonella atypica KON TaxID=1128111 RepID=A0ABN0IKV8_9FIRM|nr:excinuclease ABC subunit UvrB [Veillonella atypica]EKY20070.1 excinuclease ABC, B subunit [Veillonella atypica KON]PQL17478.1 excinuclease ABC subunit UvrB [Veillonella atypica KON]SUP06129.1 Excinuclease ABC subunit B [Veillonella atypica]